MNLQPHTLAMLRCELLSLRHPDNPDTRWTRATVHGMGLALLNTEQISHAEFQVISQLASNAVSYQLQQKPWPAEPWLPF